MENSPTKIIWEPEDIERIAEMIQNEEHQIVPIIGTDVFFVKQDGENIPLNDFIFQKVIEKFIEEESQEKVRKECTGSHLRRMKKLKDRLPRFRKEQIGYSPDLCDCVVKIMNDKEINIKNHVSIPDSVRDFLQFGHFPLIITTCHLDILRHILLAPHGQRYQSVGYYCQSGPEQDINEKSQTPTIFHLFGISNSGCKPMVSEDDFLKYMHFLHNTPSAPPNLKRYLQSRTVLTLGCDIPDWAFRFILHSLMEMNGTIETRPDLKGATIKRYIEPEFQEFLSDISYLPGEDISTILTPINRMFPKKTLFLSYSAKEGAPHEQDGIQIIKRKLESYFSIVWFFPEQSKKEYGEKYWDKIQEGLNKCDVFLAVVTRNMIDQMNLVSPNGLIKDKDAGFLWEWKMMMELQQQRAEQALCLAYFLDTNITSVQNIINTPDSPLHFLGHLFNDEQNITNKSPEDFDPSLFTVLHQ